jgi:hypothetical protein
MTSYNDLESYSKRVRPIVKILLQYEIKLSDGFCYYAPEGETKELLTRIATEIQELADRDR